MTSPWESLADDPIDANVLCLAKRLWKRCRRRQCLTLYAASQMCGARPYVHELTPDDITDLKHLCQFWRYEFDEKSYFEWRPVVTFTLHKIIGKGAYGCVYEASFNENKQRVACKVFDYIEWFFRETYVLQRLQHCFYVPEVMALRAPRLFVTLGERSLFDVIYKPKTYNKSDVRRWMEQIMTAIASAHEMGVVHRDIKPSNVVQIGKDVMVIDWASSSIDITLDTANDVSRRVTTMQYRPPEMFQLEMETLTPEILQAGDVWSAGCTYYELVKREILFPNKDDKTHLEFEADFATKRKSISDVPFLEPMLEWDPCKRASASAMRDLFREATL